MHLCGLHVCDSADLVARCRHYEKADAVATDKKLPLWSMDVCKAFRVAPLLIQQDGCDVCKKSPLFLTQTEKVLDCHKSRCGCTFFRMYDELPHIPKSPMRLQTFSKADAVSLLLFRCLPMLADFRPTAPDRPPRWAVIQSWA